MQKPFGGSRPGPSDEQRETKNGWKRNRRRKKEKDRYVCVVFEDGREVGRGQFREDM